MASNAPFTQLDFDQLKDNLKTYLRGQDRFRDYDFEGSNMNVLLDLLAYNTYHNNIYNNMMFSELFMDSAGIRENVMSHAKELNYLPSSMQSARAVLDVNIRVQDPTNGPTAVTIPQGTKFNAVCGSTTYTFITDRNRAVRKVSNQYRITDLRVFEGRLLREFYTVDGVEPQQFIINNENVDISSIRVFIRDDTNENSVRREYVRRDDIFGTEEEDLIFYVEPHFDNLYKVAFGRNRFGRQPVNGEVVELEYRITRGAAANGSRNWSPVNLVAGFPVGINNVSIAASNGADRETIEDIKFFAPRALQIQERAVTESDYETLLKQRFPNIQTISVYGGDEADPPQYGKVMISVDVLGRDGSGISEVQEYKNYLRDKTPLTIEPVFVAPQFLYVNLTLRVAYNPNLTSKSSDDIELAVKNAITTFSDSNLNRFNSTLRQSRLAAACDATDVSILSTDIVAEPIIQYLPNLGRNENPTFQFNDRLVQPYPLSEASGFDTYKPAVRSTKFVLNGSTVTLQDDGNGKVIAVSAASSNRRIINPNLGTVNYENGTVRLINLTVDSFTGSSINIIANTTNKDINSTKNKILVLRENDISIQMVPVR